MLLHLSLGYKDTKANIISTVIPFSVLMFFIENKIIGKTKSEILITLLAKYGAIKMDL